jgi:hypothetical protein
MIVEKSPLAMLSRVPATTIVTQSIVTTKESAVSLLRFRRVSLNNTDVIRSAKIVGMTKTMDPITTPVRRA